MARQMSASLASNYMVLDHPVLALYFHFSVNTSICHAYAHCFCHYHYFSLCSRTRRRRNSVGKKLDMQPMMGQELYGILIM